MNKSFIALALALSVTPIAALAQDSNASAPTADQRQAMRQTFQQFAAQEAQLHQQMRWQMLSALTPVHRRAVGATIGDLAIEPTPDLQAAAKRIDAVLSPGERQRIIAAHATFATQSRQLHEQMRTQMQSEMPAGAPDMMKHGPGGGTWGNRQLDAGTLLLMGLAPHPMRMHGEGAPPQ
jgi:hypothetical protein